MQATQPHQDCIYSPSEHRRSTLPTYFPEPQTADPRFEQILGRSDNTDGRFSSPLHDHSVESPIQEPNARPHKCDSCPQAFSTRGQLKYVSSFRTRICYDLVHVDSYSAATPNRIRCHSSVLSCHVSEASGIEKTLTAIAKQSIPRQSQSTLQRTVRSRGASSREKRGTDFLGEITSKDT